MKFNITKVVPEGFLHHSGFNEVIDSLAWVLADLGHEVNVTQNWFSEQREHNIIFGAELIADFQRLPPNTTIFNLEQPSHPNMEKVRRLARESNCRVWDYSHRAVGEWKASGHENVYWVPIGYTPNLQRITITSTEDIDVIFYGWMTPRRVNLIEELKRHGLNVVATANCYGGGRDNLISRAKVCLNIHHDGRDRFEIVRCSYLMANYKCVVTEPSVDDDEYEDLKGGLSVSPYRLMVDTCVSLCQPSASQERQGMRASALRLIQNRDFKSCVESVLDTDVPPPVKSLDKIFAKRNFLSEARELRKNDPRVAARFKAARQSGDMKDFVEWMRDHAKGNILEIGVRDGASTSAFLSGVEKNGGHVYSIDVQPCGKLFEGHPQWSFLQCDSKDIQATTKFIPFEIDILLIDGDHSRAGVINDIEYARQLRPGGMVIFHDIAPEERPSGCNDMSWPGDDVKTVYWSLVESMGEMGWTHEEPPGRYGLGVLHKPAAVPVMLPELVDTK